MKVVYGSPDVTTKYCYDGAQVIAEYEDGSLARKYIYGPEIDEPIAMIDVSDGDKVYYYHFDPLGSVVALSDANGILVERYEYDVYGEPTILAPNNELRTISSYGNPYMFTGRRYDTETALYYYRARCYSPEIGRFLQPDPIAQASQLDSARLLASPAEYEMQDTHLSLPIGQFSLQADSIRRVSRQDALGFLKEFNLYSYVRNNPISFVDPWGLQPTKWEKICALRFEICKTLCTIDLVVDCNPVKWMYCTVKCIAKHWECLTEGYPVEER